MNSSLLAELRSLRSAPSVTVLLDTIPGDSISPNDVVRLHELADDVNQRLTESTNDELRAQIVSTIRRLVDTAAAGRCGEAIAICASPEHEAIVRLGRSVQSRVAIGDSFATDDMVADPTRTATFRVVLIGEGLTHLYVGDRERLVEVRDGGWPLRRSDLDDPSAWTERISDALVREQMTFDSPVVLVGERETIHPFVSVVDPAGTVEGPHDPECTTTLHELCWPVAEQGRAPNRSSALARLDEVRGSRLFVGDVHEVRELAVDGRIEILVVEDDYRLTRGLASDATDDDESPGERSVDELIDIVVAHGGEFLMVPPGELANVQQLAAVLRA